MGKGKRGKKDKKVFDPKSVKPFDRAKCKNQLIDKDFKIPGKVYDGLPSEVKDVITGMTDRLVEAKARAYYDELSEDAVKRFLQDHLSRLSVHDSFEDVAKNLPEVLRVADELEDFLCTELPGEH